MVSGLVSCARKAPPSGGPPDVDPPRIVSASPDSGAARVPVGARLVLTFSEGMEPHSTNDAIVLAPRVDLKQWKWSGRTVTVVLAETLRANQTYTMSVGGAARDRHGNPMGEGKSWVFTTSESLPPGRITGVVEGRGFDVMGTYLWCYDQSRPPIEPDSTARDFDALGIADRTGRFRIEGLTVPGRFRIWAFADLNQNKSFEPDKDLLAPAETLFALTREAPAADSVHLLVINPRAPGKVRGTVLDSLGVSEGVIEVVAVSSADTTRRVVVNIGTRNEYEFSLTPGPWTVRAFRDLDGNHRWLFGVEAASDSASVRVAPAAEIPDLVLVMRRPGEAR